MHRQRKLHTVFCRNSQVRFAATAAKRQPVSFQVETTSAHPLTELLKSTPRDCSTSTSSSPKPTYALTDSGRWFQKLSLDPPSSGLSKWSRLSEPIERAAPSYSPRGELRLQRDLAPHQSAGRSISKPFGNAWNSGRQDPRGNIRANSPTPQNTHSERTFGIPPSHFRNGRDYLSGKRTEDHPTATLNNFEVKGEEMEPVDELGSSRIRKGSTSRGGLPGRDTFKARGSLVSRIREDAAIPSHSKVSALRSKFDTPKPHKKRAFLEKKVTVDVIIPSTISVGTLARLLNIRLDRLQRKMVQAGMGNEASYDYVLTSDYAALLAEEFGRNPVVNDEAAFDIHPSPPHPNTSTLPSRPPVVTIMGHVDHGKTTLLDTLRSSSVAKGEAGGITQHIGAFSVPVPESCASETGPPTITFLDTPGHAAFSAMRARGARVTDIVVLVVAADDGVMPQTREVIELIRKDQGKIGVVVAINKVDKPGVDVDRVKNALLSENMQLETLGGDIPSVEVSGLTGQGLNDLVETLSTMAELQDLRAERVGPAHGCVLESKVHKGLGPVATVLVLRGCLKLGSHIISGTSYAKVRAMNDSSGDSIQAAYPGMAIMVSGWKALPNAGDEVLQGSETDVKKAVTNRMRRAEMESTLVDVEAINTQRRQERERKDVLGETGEVPLVEAVQGPKELRLVIKGDVSGSVEAVVGALQGIGNKQAVVKIVSSGVGDVSESDVMMAKATEGMIVAFSVSTPRSVENIATQNNVPICSSNIIYRLMEDIKQRVIALLPVIVEKKVTGEATVLQLFDIHLKAKETKKIAGCRVINGILEKAKGARVVRNGVTIHEGIFNTLRYMKKDITEARKGSECGLSFHDFDHIREGDLVQVYQDIEKPGLL